VQPFADALFARGAQWEMRRSFEIVTFAL